jgi:hypothetical protein
MIYLLNGTAFVVAANYTRADMKMLTIKKMLKLRK